MSKEHVGIIFFSFMQLSFAFFFLWIHFAFLSRASSITTTSDGCGGRAATAPPDPGPQPPRLVLPRRASFGSRFSYLGADSSGSEVDEDGIPPQVAHRALEEEVDQEGWSAVT
jgi:hypothetical protein